MNRLTKVLPYETLALGLTLLASFLRAITLEHRPLTIDEFGAVKTAALQTTLEIATRYHTTNHVLAQILARWTGLIDYSLFFLRLPSLWFGVLGVALLYRLGRSLAGPQAGLLAALLLALAPLHVGYSQEVRGYAALAFGALLLFFCLEGILRDGGWRYWLGYSLAAILTPYAHLFGAAPVAVSAAVLGYELGRSGRWRASEVRLRLVLCGLLVGVGLAALFAPLLGDIIALPAIEGWSGDIAPWWQAGTWQREALGDYGRLFLALSPSGELGSPGGWLFALLALIGALGLARRRPRSALWLLAWLIGPVLLTLAGFLVFPGFYAYRRFYLFMLPPYLLLIAEAALWPGRRLAWGGLWAGGAALVLFGFLGGLWWQTYRADLAGRWQATARYLAQQAAPADRVVCEAYGRWGELRAAHRDRCFRELSIRLEEARAKGRLAEAPALNLEVDELATLENIEAFPDLAFGPGGVWLVLWQADWPARPLGEPAAPAGVRLIRFGSTLLVESRARPALAENLAEGLEALVRLENQPGDQFLYYLSLAQMRAALGQAPEARAALEAARRLSPPGMGSPERIRITQEAVLRVAGGE